MKVGEIWENNNKYSKFHIIQVKITNIYQSNEIVNPGSIAKDKTYVSSVYVYPFNDGSHHADLSREHFLEEYFKTESMC